MFPFLSQKLMHKIERVLRFDKLPLSVRSTLPHLLLFILTVIYLLIGGAIFRAAEIAGSDAIIIWHNASGDGEEATNPKVHFTGNYTEIRPAEEAWSFRDSVLFCFVTITTIGYGNLAPKTLFGRLFLFFYGILGIPMLGICLADIGKFIAKLCWSVLIVAHKLGLYVRRDAYGMKTDKPPSSDQPIPFWMSFLIFVVYTIVGACFFPFYEKMGWMEACYFSFVSLTTIGYGDYYPENYQYLLLTVFYITTGLALNMMALSVLGNMLQKMHYVGQPITDTARTTIMFGGKELDLEEVIRHISKRLGVPESDVDKLIDNLDHVITDKVEERETEARGEPIEEKNNISAEDFDVTFYGRERGKLRRLKHLVSASDK